MGSAEQSTRFGFKQFAWLVSAALIVRALCGLAGWQSLHEDPDAYAQLAVGLADQGVLGFASNEVISPSAFRPPLYPWLLSWLVSDSALWIAGVFVFHLAMAIAIAALVYSIAGKLKLRWPVLAGLLVTIDPLLIRAGQQVMTELLATMLAVTVWWLWLTIWPKSDASENYCQTTQRSAGQWVSLYGLGIVFGLSILARPTAAPWAAVCVAGMLWFGCVCWKRRMVDMVVVTTGVLLCVLPWTLRNMAELGRPIWATTHGGYTMLLANNPSLYQHFIHNGPGRDWNAEPFHDAWANRGKVGREILMDQAYWLEWASAGRATDEARASNFSEDITEDRIVYSLGELHDDSLAYALAIQTIQTDPKTFSLSCFYRFGWLWAWWPSGAGTATTLAIGSWYGAILVLALRGLFELLRGGGLGAKCRKIGSRITTLGHWLPGLALIVVLSSVHCVYWSNMRMRAPVMPCIYLLALVPLVKRTS